MIVELAALGSRTLSQRSGAEDEIIAAWVVGVLLAGALVVFVGVSAYRVVQRERWRRDVSKLLSSKSSDVERRS
jgi:hypothetical protein